MTGACRNLSLACALLGLLAFQAEAGPNPPVSAAIVELSPGGLGTDSQALGINTQGVVVGSALGIDGNQHAFIYSAGSMTLLGGGGSTSVAYGINDSGVLVGSMNGQAFSFSSATAQVSFLATLPGTTASTAFAINKNGVIVGTSTVGVDTLAFTNASVASQAVPLGVLPGQADSVALGINGSGQTVGASGGQAYFTISDQTPPGFTLVDLGSFLFPGQTSVATGMNDHKTVVGTTSDGVTSRGWTYSKGKGTIIPSLPGATDCVPHGINSSGVVVGTSGGRAFKYSNGKTLDLNTLIPAGSSFASLNSAAAINDGGTIVGVGTTLDGHSRGFILTP